MNAPLCVYLKLLNDTFHGLSLAELGWSSGGLAFLKRAEVKCLKYYMTLNAFSWMKLNFLFYSRRILHRDLKAKNIFLKDNLLKIGEISYFHTF